MNRPLLIGIGFLLSTAACNTPPKTSENPNIKEYKQPLLEANKSLVALENQDIENYMKRNNWSMVETGSGLRYMIYKNGNGKQVQTGKVVQCEYETSLLTGKVCYSSQKLGPKEFLVGRGGVESGLEEMVLLLREGDEVKIILPSHLAFGLVGDDDCIPKKAVVVYDLKVINVLDPIKRN